MTPRIRKSAQGGPPQHGAAAHSSDAPGAPGAAPPQSDVPESRQIFRRSARSLRGSFRRRMVPPLKPAPGLLTPAAASAILTEVFRHLLDATKREVGADLGGSLDKPPAEAEGGQRAEQAGFDSLTSLLKGCLEEISGVLLFACAAAHRFAVCIIAVSVSC